MHTTSFVIETGCCGDVLKHMCTRRVFMWLSTGMVYRSYAMSTYRTISLAIRRHSTISWSRTHRSSTNCSKRYANTRYMRRKISLRDVTYFRLLFLDSLKSSMGGSVVMYCFSVSICMHLLGRLQTYLSDAGQSQLTSHNHIQRKMSNRSINSSNTGSNPGTPQQSRAQ